MTVHYLNQEFAALNRLLEIAQDDSGQCRKVADFLLAWWNPDDCGRFDLRDLWMLDRAIADDILAVIGLIAKQHAYPDTLGFGPQFERLVALWRPQRAADRPAQA